MSMVGLVLAVFGLAAPAKAAVRDAHDLAGVWWVKAYRADLAPSDGQPPPFTAQGKARYTANKAGLKSGAIVDQATYACTPEGMPRAMTSAYPFQIIATPAQMAFAHEVNHAYRIVAMAERHQDPKIWDPSYMGDPIAHWDGDTLVVDTTNFKADAIYLDATGLPASDKLHLVEQIRLIDGGAGLEDRITVDDPVMFAKPWTATRVYQRRDDVRVQADWVCGEPHRDVSAVLRDVVGPAPADTPPARATDAVVSASHAAMDGYWNTIVPPGTAYPPTSPDILAKMRPWTAEAYAKVLAAQTTGEFVPNSNTECMPNAVPGSGSNGGLAYGIDVLVEPRQVTVLYEVNRVASFIYLDQQHPARLAPSWMGHAIGHWEGDTLVVDTVGFNDRNEINVGDNVKIHTPDLLRMTAQMHVVERLRLLPNGQLEDQAIFDDPGAFTAPFTIVTHYRRGQPFQEYICQDNNREGGFPTATGQPQPTDFVPGAHTGRDQR